MSFRLLPGARLEAVNIPLRVLIERAYDLDPLRVTGGPAWLGQGPDWSGADRFDILAKAPGDALRADAAIEPTMRLMLQRLLEERFSLRVHSETRTMPVYALQLARRDGRVGPSMRPTASTVRQVAVGKGQVLFSRGSSRAPFLATSTVDCVSHRAVQSRQSSWEALPCVNWRTFCR